ncbi:predicted protein [Phaeodactylum tricornutum CCAP 1055/1]|uniref:BCNT-C domain-containing protein n=1 Tax=Phaeodactylum tricornutum (strain CCAP 1055/1) TaxID=556484 RepID=B7G0Z1_PHATC|nr:predicted protein [Phaeodactylum tricornutum CCAP 1055/1]EEC47411.1 predicted protein [Phaeodactylum tricornutum CCAP 1055/1]|eukprot:XP_002180759.1 predicted protein [Phaeodactylum tricornutum CCAP 1055/1]
MATSVNSEHPTGAIAQSSTVPDDDRMQEAEEDEDEDFRPEEEPANDEDDDDNERMPTTTSSPSLLSTMQLRTVDAAFESLFGYPWGTEFALAVDGHKATKTDRRLAAREQLLSQILGPTAAAAVLYSHHNGKGVENVPLVIHSHRPTTHEKKVVVVRKTPRYKTKPDTPQLSKQPTIAVATNRDTNVAREGQLPSSQGPPQLPATTKSKGGGVDQLLQNLQNPNAKTTTIAKTSADWESFKDQTGLGTKLEEQAESKHAYLKRQDFLHRVDNRTFELEKQERDQERSKRGK